jgi:hypothetical protein
MKNLLEVSVPAAAISGRMPGKFLRITPIQTIYRVGIAWKSTFDGQTFTQRNDPGFAGFGGLPA